MNPGVLNHFLKSENLGKVLLAEILVVTVVEKFDSIQQFKIQLSIFSYFSSQFSCLKSVTKSVSIDQLSDQSLLK